MSTVASQRTIITARQLLNVLDVALTLTKELEEVAYDEADFAFFFAARKLEQDLQEHRDVLAKLISRADGGSQHIH